MCPDLLQCRQATTVALDRDDATRTRRTKLTLVDPPEELRLGAVVTAVAIVEAARAIRLPSSAIKADGSNAIVWVVDEKQGTVSSRAVTVDDRAAPGTIATVIEGLKPGERVVVAGVNKLQDGQAVRIEQEIAQ